MYQRFSDFMTNFPNDLYSLSFEVKILVILMFVTFFGGLVQSLYNKD